MNDIIESSGTSISIDIGGTLKYAKNRIEYIGAQVPPLVGRHPGQNSAGGGAGSA